MTESKCYCPPEASDNFEKKTIEKIATILQNFNCCDDKEKREKLKELKTLEETLKMEETLKLEKLKKLEILHKKLEKTLKMQEMEKPLKIEKMVKTPLKMEKMVPGDVLTQQAKKAFFADELPLSGSYQLQMAVFHLRRLWRWFCAHAPQKIGSPQKFAITLVSDAEFLDIFTDHWLPLWNYKMSKQKHEKFFKKFKAYVYTKHGTRQKVKTAPDTEGVIWVCSDGQIIVPQMFITRKLTVPGNTSMSLTQLGKAQLAILSDPTLTEADKEERWKRAFFSEVESNSTGNHYRNHYTKASNPYGHNN